MRMRTFVYSLYFYTILGGFLIIVALINLLRGYYIEDLVGYVLLFPAALLAVFLSVNLKSLSIKKNKFNMNFLPFLLFLSWILLTAVLGSTYQNGFNQLILYMAFFSAIPYFLGLIISNKVCYVRYRWSVAIFLILLVLGLASVISKWHDLTYGRYRVTGFADKVIMGGQELISKASVLILETSFQPLYQGQPFFDDIYKLLRARGFVYEGCENIGRDPENGRILFCDSVFCKEDWQNKRLDNVNGTVNF